MINSKVIAVLTELSKLNLARYPYYEIKNLIGKLGKVAIIGATFHPGKRIYRARPNENGEHFSTASQLSYKPASYNLTFQRASTPHTTMFYGAVLPPNLKFGELDSTQVVGLFEVLDFMRSTDSSGERVLTFGKWVVTKKINLCAVLFHHDFLSKSNYTQTMYDGYINYLNRFPKFKVDSLLVSDFFAKQFAKSFTPIDYYYMLSSCFSEMIVEKGLAGVLYPSVRTEGKGFNVALSPYYADNCLELEAVGECTVYKRRGQTFVDNEQSALVLVGQKDFTLKPVLPQFHAGRDIIMSELYSSTTLPNF